MGKACAEDTPRVPVVPLHPLLMLFNPGSSLC